MLSVAMKAKTMKKTLAKVKKDLKIKTKTRSRGMARRSATVVLAQGAAAAPRRNFGTQGVGKRASVGSLMRCLDARVPRTLGLPRAVGPYTIIRTTRLHQSDGDFIMFAPFLYGTPNSQGWRWRNWCGVEDVASGTAISGASNTKPMIMPMDELGDAVEVVPAGLTVQVMNPESLQNATGVFAMTRVNQQLSLGGSTDTWEDLKQRVISFYTPRLLTGGKLALRGVKCSAYPLNMSEYSSFMPLAKTGNAAFTWEGAGLAPGALSPIVFVQQNEIPKTMEFLVTIEWRVRFDPGNPATASHIHHDTLSDEAWNAVVKGMSSCGHGVEELSEDVAEAGAMGYGAMRAIGALGEVAVPLL